VKFPQECHSAKITKCGIRISIWDDDDDDARTDDGLHLHLLGNALPLTLTATLSTHLTYNLITHTHFINSFSAQPSAPFSPKPPHVPMAIWYTYGREICLAH